MSMTLKSQFLSLFKENEEHQASELFNFLESCYNEEGRFYHTFKHIESCIRSLNLIKNNVIDFEAISMALFFHDIVYNTKSLTNEFDSAELMKRKLLDFDFSDHFLEKVYNLILLTQHPSVTEDSDALHMIDIDLLVLSSDRDVFLKYHDDIKKEYSWVPENLFESNRKEFLSTLLNNYIYRSDSYRHLNERAKKNINSVL